MNIKDTHFALEEYCKKNNYSGYDPYDGLNSKFFQFFPFLRNRRFFRLAWIQLFKITPLNLRRIFGVSKEYNAKGLGLFLTGYCNLYKMDNKEEYLEKINFLADTLLSLKSEGYSGACWGYNFDWQARAFFQPKGTPTVVASTFIGYALLDAYEITKRDDLLETAISIKDFILKDLNRTIDNEGDFAFSYSQLDNTQVFNASLLGSRMLSRIYSYTKDESLLQVAKKSVSFCCKYQQENGAWSYGTLPHHLWVDSFHTGYNLECISEYKKYSNDNSFDSYLEKGFDYYVNTFFSDDGRCKYYNNKIYPIDIHAPAQLVLTLSRLKKFKDHKSLVDNVLTWTIKNMQDKNGFFYYQIKKGISSKIPYMRWAQAWMFYSLSFYLLEEHNE